MCKLAVGMVLQNNLGRFCKEAIEYHTGILLLSRLDIFSQEPEMHVMFEAMVPTY